MNTGDVFSQFLNQRLKTTTEQQKNGYVNILISPWNGSSSSLLKIFSQDFVRINVRELLKHLFSSNTDRRNDEIFRKCSLSL